MIHIYIYILYEYFCEKACREETICKPRHIKLYNYIIETYLELTEWEFMDWIRLAYDTEK